MKILCLGNADNIGARLYTWLKAEGKDVTLMRTPFDEGGGERSDPELYNVNPKETHLINLTLYETILPSLFSSKNIRNLNKKFDIVLI
ncbi:MAG: DUF4350 domain-containing protein, partial [Flavobacteriales bacterium]|nr:DUF4350 domain-containing protein [Flavobacteriales bacterium]